MFDDVVNAHHSGVSEARRGERKIGTTSRGIGPAYEDKIARRGVRVGDLANPDLLAEAVKQNVAARNRIIGDSTMDWRQVLDELAQAWTRMSPWVTDVSLFLSRARLAGRSIMAAALLGFARSLGEFGATIMIAGSIPGITRTLPVAIYTFAETGRDREAALLAGDDGVHVGEWIDSEELPDVEPGVRMGATHELRTDKRDVDVARHDISLLCVLAPSTPR